MIEVSGLTKSFVTPAGELRVLRGINCKIHKGEMIAIVGASGAGKSTLLHIMGTLDSPTTGSVAYDGNNVFSMDEAALSSFRNKTVGFVFQFHHLLPEFTALENIMMPALIRGADKNESLSNAEHLLDRLGVLDRKTHRPGELSGGEQQRVAVARALILNPRVVLADEPTGNLDTKTGEELFGLLEGLNKENAITFIMVKHNESLAKKCGRVFEMKDGSLKESYP